MDRLPNRENLDKEQEVISGEIVDSALNGLEPKEGVGWPHEDFEQMNDIISTFTGKTIDEVTPEDIDKSPLKSEVAAVAKLAARIWQGVPYKKEKE